MVFNNSNAESWLAWIFRKKDDCPAVTIYFMSRLNATSPRFFPLYNNTEKLRIVVFRGLRIPKTDRAILWLVNLFVLFFAKKLRTYRYFVDHGYRYANVVKTNLIIQLDDPSFDAREIGRLREFSNMRIKDEVIKIVVTSEQIKRKVVERGITSRVEVIEQGYSDIESGLEMAKFPNFSLVYSSNYIHHANDKHGSHPNWGASEFIETLIPSILSKLPEVEIHLVGELGPNAQRLMKQYVQVICHGRVSTSTNSSILRRCHLGLYPRKHDNGWRVQKINEYLGARLPIVTFNLEDTGLVRELGIGLSVNTNDEFIEAIELLLNDRYRYQEFVRVADSVRDKYDWKVLANKLDDLFLN